jgi:hypothetical protein
MLAVLSNHPLNRGEKNFFRRASLREIVGKSRQLTARGVAESLFNVGVEAWKTCWIGACQMLSSRRFSVRQLMIRRRLRDLNCRDTF